MSQSRHTPTNPDAILNFQIADNFYCIVARITKFDVFSSEFDFRQLRLCVTNIKIQHGDRMPSGIFTLQITLMPFLQNLNSDGVCYILQMPESKMAVCRHIEFLNCQ